MKLRLFNTVAARRGASVLERVLEAMLPHAPRGGADVSLASRIALQLGPKRKLRLVAQTSARRTKERPAAGVAAAQQPQTSAGRPPIDTAELESASGVGAEPGRESAPVLCSSSGCSRRVLSRGLCSAHFLRERNSEKRWDAAVERLVDNESVRRTFAKAVVPPSPPERQIRPYIGHPEGPTPNEYPGDAEYSAALDAKLTSPCKGCAKPTKAPDHWCRACRGRGIAPPPETGSTEPAEPNWRFARGES